MQALKVFSTLFMIVIAQLQSNAQKISLITCGPGDEIYSSFGHSGIRLVDTLMGIDQVYNWGTFNGFAPDFEWKFMKGKLLYYVSTQDFQSFLQSYQAENRSVHEQELAIDSTQFVRIKSVLNENLLEENKYYQYDFIFDNCATRIRDIFQQAYGTGFRYGPYQYEKNKVSYRYMINQYLSHRHWERFGINLLLGKQVDKKMNSKASMFLPDFLEECLSKATYQGMLVAKPTVKLFTADRKRVNGWNQPFLLCLALAMLTLLSYLWKSRPFLFSIMRFIVLFVSGLLGTIILFMWFGTDHQSCQDNYNLLWALPTNLIVAFMPQKGKQRYALIAIMLIGALFCLHLFQVQWFSLFELSPLLIALFLIYAAMISKNSKSHDAILQHKT